MRVFEFDRFLFDPADGRLADRSGSGEVHLRPQAGALLARLLSQPQTVVGRDTLVREIWGEETVVDFESGLAALLRELRQAIQSLGGDPKLLETVPRRGYRIRAEVRCIEKTRRETARSGGARWRRSAAAVLLVLLAAALAGVIWWNDSPMPGSSAVRSHQMAILPLERFGDPDHLPAQAGILLADGILAELWRAELANLELIGRAGMRPYAGRDDVVSAIAADLGVDLLIEGSVRFASDGWRVDLRLLEVPPGRVLWSQTVEGDSPVLPTGVASAQLVDELTEAWPEIRKLLNSR